MKTFFENEILHRLSNGLAAGTGTDYSDPIDTQGCDSVVLFAGLGTISGAGTIAMTIQQGDLANGSDGADLAGAVVNAVAANSDKILAVEIYRPRKRYLRVKFVRAVANGEVDFVCAVLRDSQRKPVTQSADIAGFELLASPLEA